MRILYPERIGFWSVGFSGGMETGEPEKKPEAGRERATTSTHIWHRAGFERARATLVRGERSHHCTILARRHPLSVSPILQSPHTHTIPS